MLPNLKLLCVATASVCLVAGLPACTMAKSHEPMLVAEGPAPQPAADHVVDALGVKMRFTVIPGSEETVLLEAGSGLGADVWTETARMIADATGATVISYDRAGMGQSEMPPGTYDVYEEVARLHRGLVELGQADRLILVGHSYGGFLVHVYANLYPEAIDGMVYVDANTPMGIDGIGGADAVTAPSIRRNDVENPTRQQRAGLRLSYGFAETMETVRKYPPLCGVPTVVISAGKYADSMPKEKIEGWRSGHYDLVRRTGGKHVIDEISGHMVPEDDPQAIVSAIQYILGQAGGSEETVRSGHCNEQ